MNILDKIILPKETKNLHKINVLAEKFNSYLDKSFLLEIERELLKIKTKEHKNKIEFYVQMINQCLK